MAIIEVEKKFVLKPGQCFPWVCPRRERFLDEYYDNSSFALTGKNWWLRRRAGIWELKAGRFGPKRTATMYEEIIDEEHIADLLDLTLEDEGLSLTLFYAGYLPFARLVTERVLCWYKDDFLLSVDTVSAAADDFEYEIAEIELQVPEEERDTALVRINDLAKSLGLDDRPVRGKLIEYLRLFRPDHFKFLLKRGVIFPELAA